MQTQNSEHLYHQFTTPILYYTCMDLEKNDLHDTRRVKIHIHKDVLEILITLLKAIII